MSGDQYEHRTAMATDAERCAYFSAEDLDELPLLPHEKQYLPDIKANIAELRVEHQRSWEEEHPGEDPGKAPALPMPPFLYEPPAEDDKKQFVGRHAALMRNGAPLAAIVGPFLQLADCAGVHVGRLDVVLPIDGDEGWVPWDLESPAYPEDLRLWQVARAKAEREGMPA